MQAYLAWTFDAPRISQMRASGASSIQSSIPAGSNRSTAIDGKVRVKRFGMRRFRRVSRATMLTIWNVGIKPKRAQA